MNNYFDEYATFSILTGKILESVDHHIRGIHGDDGDELIFKCTDGDVFKLFHRQDCCENVYIEDICGDIIDIVNTPVLYADEVSGETNPLWALDKSKWPTTIADPGESYTWTFYKIETCRGGITIRWFGSSNGYYSESVTFVKM